VCTDVCRTIHQCGKTSLHTHLCIHTHVYAHHCTALCAHSIHGQAKVCKTKRPCAKTLMHTPVFMHTHACTPSLCTTTCTKTRALLQPCTQPCARTHMQNFHLQAPCTQPRAMHALRFSTISEHPRMHTYLRLQLEYKMLLTWHGQHAGGGQCQEERRPVMLIHEPFSNACCYRLTRDLGPKATATEVDSGPRASIPIYIYSQTGRQQLWGLKPKPEKLARSLGHKSTAGEAGTSPVP